MSKQEMSVATSMAFGEEIYELRSALNEEKRQNTKLVGIVESCVLSGTILQEKGEVIVAENLELKKEVAQAKALADEWEKKYNKALVDYDAAEDKALMKRRNTAEEHTAQVKMLRENIEKAQSDWLTACNNADRFYKEMLKLRGEVATANALAADWEKKCNEALNDDMIEEKMLIRWKKARCRLATLAYDDGYAAAEEKWIPLYDAVCNERDDLKKQLASVEVPLEVRVEVPVEVPVEVVIKDLSMTESEKLAEESDTILQLVNALRQREESITQLIGGPAKKCLNPEDEE